MAKRKRLSRSKSRKTFSKGNGVKSKNLMTSSPMRGGIRL